MLQSVLNQTLAKQLNRQQTVTIMGVHTLGRALPANSGFHGESGWVVNNTHLGKFLRLSTRYYVLLDF